MADEKRESEGSITHGNEWEVVSLTASAYGSVPGPNKFESAEEKRENEVHSSIPKPLLPLFMSEHFVFPPCEHENLPIDLESDDTTVSEPQNMQSDADFAECNEKEHFIKCLSESDELSSIEYLYKGKQVWVSEVDVDESKVLEGHKLVEAADCSTADMVETIACSDNDDVTEPNPCLPDAKTSKVGRCSLSSYESWWRRHALSLYAHAKDASKFWSIFVAATLMGLVIIGQRWQQERWQIQYSTWNLSNSDKIVHRVLGPVSRFKDVIIGSHRRGLGSISAVDI